MPAPPLTRKILTAAVLSAAVFVCLHGSARATPPVGAPQWVNIVTQCSADPTDTTDSTSAITSCISAALTGGYPLYLPAGKYKVSSTLTIDTSGYSNAGFRIISDNAVIDGAAVPSGPVLQIQRSGGTSGSPAVDQNFALTGDLTVLGSDAAYVVQIGKTDFSDKFTGLTIDHLVANNASTSTSAGGIKVNFVLGRQLGLVGTTAGGSASVAGLALEQVQNAAISGSGSTAGASGAALLIENGASTGNTIAGFNYGAASNTCLSITSSTAVSNAFVAPNFGCTTAVNATGSGSGNVLVPPVFGGTNRGPISGGVTIVGRGALSRYSAPALSSYTALCSDDGTMFSAANATGGASSWSSASLPVTLPNPATCGAGYSVGFVTDANKAVVLTPSAGSILAGGVSMAAMTIGPNNFQFVVLRSDGTNWRVDQSSAASLVYNGAAMPGVPSRWEFPGGPGYQTTQGDNASVVSSATTSGGLAVTLPSTTAIQAGWTIAVAADVEPATIQTNATSGGTLYLASGAAVTTGAYSLPISASRAMAYVQWDGANFRLFAGGDSGNAVATTSQLRQLTGGTTMWSLGFSTLGDMPRLQYQWQASCPGTPDNIGYLLAPTAGGGGCWQAIFPQDRVDLRWMGGSSENTPQVPAAPIDPAGTADSTSALRVALSTTKTVYVPPGWWHIKDQIQCSGLGQQIIGAGRAQSVLDIGSDFNMSAADVIDEGSNGANFPTGCDIRGIGLQFYQSETDTSRSQLTHYPPAISCSGSPAQCAAVKLDDVRVSRCWDAIDWPNNSGLFDIGRVELSCFDKNFQLDGALGYSHIRSMVVSPNFGMPGYTNLQAIWGDGNTNAVTIGRCDGCDIGMLSSFEASIVVGSDNLYTTGIAIGTLDLNGNGANVTIGSGGVSIGTLVLNDGNEAVPGLLVNGPMSGSSLVAVTIGNIRGATSNTGAGGGWIYDEAGRLVINGGWINDSVDTTMVEIGASGILSMANTQFELIGSNQTTPLIKQDAGGIVMLSDISLNGSGGHTRPILSLASDSPFSKISGFSGLNAWGANAVSLGFATTLGSYDFSGFPFPFTATPIFTTEGDFAPSGTVVNGFYELHGDFAYFEANVSWSNNAYTTATGALELQTNLPVAIGPGGGIAATAALSQLSNITLGSSPQQMPCGAVLNGAGQLSPVLCASGAALANLSPTNAPAGRTGIVIGAAGWYRIR